MKKLLGVVIAAVVLAAASVGMGYLGSLWWTSHNGLNWSVTSAGWGGAGGGAGQRAASPGASAPGASAPGAPAAGGAAGPAAQAAAHEFDGNVAAIEWGGKVESATGVAADDAEGQEGLRSMIDQDPETYWRSSRDPGPKEVVLSFAEHESVLINQVTIVSDGGLAPRNLEIWVSNTGPKEGFTRVATAATPADTNENTISFDPVEARYVKLRLLRNYNEEEEFKVTEIKVMEARRGGYTPLLARHPDLLGPPPAQAGAAVAAAASPPTCVPVTQTTLTPGHGETKRALVVRHLGDEREYGGTHLKNLAGQGNSADYRQEHPELEIAARVDFTVVRMNQLADSMLNPKYGYDTVVLDQVCPEHPAPSLANFERLLPAWVADGHKLIIQDSDICSSANGSWATPADYRWLPYRIKTDAPGAQGAPGFLLRFVEDNWMAHSHRGRPGFIDTEAWENDTDGYHNELGDSNTLTEWDPHWCGHMVVRNVNNVFGFAHTYAHLGRGLIIYDGFDHDQVGTTGDDLLVARELAQGFDPDNLPCSARIGEFVVTTDTRLIQRPFVPGHSYDYPLSLLSNQGYKGTIGLSVRANPGLSGMQASFTPASVALDGLAESNFTLTVPANAPFTPQALEVKGIDAGGRTNSVCLQLVQPQTGELSVVSTLPRAKHKNLEIILDASGSMKLPLGKKTRWTTAHDVLQQMLATLPGDFNVGLRIYGHRESSRSPKTCTDSELVLPIQKLDSQAILRAAEAVHPRGETPLIYSVLQSTTDLKDVGGGTVIVITDGEESCHGDPVKAAATLKASGLDIVLNIVGFTTGQSVQKQLGGFAQATGGRFYAANSGPTLALALQMAAVDRFPYTVLDAAGKEVASGEAGAGAEELPPGEYTVVVNAGTTSLKAEHVRVALAQQTTLHITAKNDKFVLQQ
jgi:hypothetical protein